MSLFDDEFRDKKEIINIIVIIIRWKMSTKKYKWKGESRTARKGLDRVWFIFRVIATHLTFSFQLYDDKSRVITSKITMPHMLPYWLPTKEESECMHKAGGLSWLSEIYPPSYH